MTRLRTAIATLAVLTAAVATTAGCTGDGADTRDTIAGPTPAADRTALSLSVRPKAHATGLPVSTEIGATVTGGSVEEVRLVDAHGNHVDGSLRPDGTSWVPDRPLAYHRRYTATVVAVGARRQHVERRTTFTTMSEPSNRVGTGMYVQDGQTYGVGMPIAVEILRDVPKNLRASVQRRLFVHSDPPQPGAWHWFGPRRVEYRPATWWQPGTKLTVRMALGGLPMGHGGYGDTDRSATARISSDRIELRITNRPKQMKVYRNGRLARTMPVSLGKADAPSSSGHMVIMDKAAHTVFDTRGIPGENYVAPVDNAQRLTWGGEFIHAAPWSVADQGHRNVSHGCVNISDPDAAWLFARTHIGDPVTVSGTGTRLAPGNGWTDWDMDWDTFVAGSALPVPDSVRNATAYDPYPRR
ncbi:L,D-transpeptidase [Actinocatenispora sera]|uniref:L,D-TPase catalytic domain-containing protein n=1 Tax=Actinocatenispora sera TaxID=390989 RepID=A0A810LA09_9ACTN|nr:Ig-like domain-containing protein [Actinocatenispora sera]BCJ32394.1 hypothetical protein Asera_65020 [Actinocatenispora sera]